MKYYLIYLKPNTELYGFTSEKDYFETFMLQRNSEKFLVKKEKITGEEEKRFLYLNHNKMIKPYPYQHNTGDKEYTMLMATADEDNRLDMEVEKMNTMVVDIECMRNAIPFKDKYELSIDNLTDIYDENGHILIDSLSLFIDLNKETFI